MEKIPIITAILIILLSIILPIYFSNKKKKFEMQLRTGREVSEREKIRVYLNNINEKFRLKRRK